MSPVIFSYFGAPVYTWSIPSSQGTKEYLVRHAEAPRLYQICNSAYSKEWDACMHGQQKGLNC